MHELEFRHRTASGPTAARSIACPPAMPREPAAARQQLDHLELRRRIVGETILAQQLEREALQRIARPAARSLRRTRHDRSACRAAARRRPCTADRRAPANRRGSARPRRRRSRRVRRRRRRVRPRRTPAAAARACRRRAPRSASPDAGAAARSRRPAARLCSCASMRLCWALRPVLEISGGSSSLDRPKFFRTPASRTLTCC